MSSKGVCTTCGADDVNLDNAEMCDNCADEMHPTSDAEATDLDAEDWGMSDIDADA